MALFGKNPPAPETPPAATPPAAPQYVTQEQFSTLDARLGRLADLMEQNASRPVIVQAPQAPHIEEPEMSDAELDAAIEQGKEAAPRIKKLIEQRLNRAQRQHASEVETLRNYGTAMLGSHAERIFIGALSEDDKKAFSRFEKEVRGLVGQCDPAIQGHPDTWDTAFSTVLGRHRHELQAEARESAIRQQDEERRAAAAPQPGRSGRAPSASADDAGNDPTIQELAGEWGQKYLGDVSEDEFIRKINRGLPARRRYKDWADYNARGREVEKQLASLRDGSDDDPDPRTLPERLQ